MKHKKAENDALTCDDLRAVLDVEIGALAEKYRTPLVLCYLEGRSYDQAARELGCPKSTLASRLSRALGLLPGSSSVVVSVCQQRHAATLGEMTEAAPVSAVLMANTVTVAALAAVGKGVADGFITANALALAKEAMAGMVGMKKVVMLAGVIGLALGGEGGRNTQRQRQKAIDKPRPALASQKAPARKPLRRVRGHVWTYREIGYLKAGVEPTWNPAFQPRRPINSLFFSPDGKTIVSEGSGNIRLWDAASGKELRKISIGESTWVYPDRIIYRWQTNDSPARRYHRYHSSMEPD